MTADHEQSMKSEVVSPVVVKSIWVGPVCSVAGAGGRNDRLLVYTVQPLAARLSPAVTAALVQSSFPRRSHLSPAHPGVFVEFLPRLSRSMRI
jgi:hypothetical protein